MSEASSHAAPCSPDESANRISATSADGASNHLIDLSKLSVGISVKIDGPDRLRNISLVVRFFRTFFRNLEIIIVEQSDAEAQCAHLAGDGVKHFWLRTKDCHYKPRNLNLAASLSCRPYLMMCDAHTFIKPECMTEAIKLLDEGAEFVSPYNGIFVEVNNAFACDDLDFKDLLDKLPYFGKLYELRPDRHDFSVARPLHGGVKSDATGGIMMYRREPFFLIGGWNENLISYGFEDMELHARIERLGYEIHRIINHNCYHLPHQRSIDGRFNSLHAVNQHEIDRVTTMPVELLSQYCQRRFREVELDVNCEFRLVNNWQQYSFERVNPNRQNLSNLSIVIAINHADSGPIVSFINVLEYIEEHFNDYEIIIVEIGSSKFKYLPNQKNVVYRWLQHGHSIADAVSCGIKTASRDEKEIHVIDGAIDSTKILRHYAERHESQTSKQVMAHPAVEQAVGQA